MTIPARDENKRQKGDLHGAESLPPFGPAAFEAELTRLQTILWQIAITIGPRLKTGCEPEVLANELVLLLGVRLRVQHAKGLHAEFERLKNGRNIHGWVGESLRNRCRNLLKAEKRIANRHQRFGAEYPESENPYPAADAGLDALELREEVKQALARLEPEQRLVFLRRILEKWKWERIEAEVGISVSTAQRYVKQACARLRNDLRDFRGSIPEIELEPDSENQNDQQEEQQ